MKTIIGGSIAALLGLLGFSFFFSSFLSILAGIIPIILILGGVITIYLNYSNNSADCCDTTNSQNMDNGCCTNLSSAKKQSEAKPAVIDTKANTKEKKDSDEPITNESVEKTDQLVGNTESLVFHNADCKFSKSKNCTVFFNSSEEAVKENYKPCGICKP